MDGSAVLRSIASAFGEGDDVVDLIAARLAADVADAVVLKHDRTVDALLSGAGAHTVAAPLLGGPCLRCVVGAVAGVGGLATLGASALYCHHGMGPAFLGRGELPIRSTPGESLAIASLAMTGRADTRLVERYEVVRSELSGVVPGTAQQRPLQLL